MKQKTKSLFTGSEMYNATQYTLSLLFMFTMIFAVVGTYFAHMGRSGASFGSLEGSLSILAVVLILMNWTRYADPAGTTSLWYHGIILLFLVTACIVATIDFVSAHLAVIPIASTGTPEAAAHVGMSLRLPGTAQSSMSLLAFAFAAKHMVKHIGWMYGNLRRA